VSVSLAVAVGVGVGVGIGGYYTLGTPLFTGSARARRKTARGSVIHIYPSKIDMLRFWFIIGHASLALRCVWGSGLCGPDGPVASIDVTAGGSSWGWRGVVVADASWGRVGGSGGLGAVDVDGGRHL
jgi:hypothetical protein